MSKPIRADKKTWTFEPDDNVRQMVNLIIEYTGWTRTKVINEVLAAYVGTYAFDQIHTRKQAIEELEINLFKAIESVPPIVPDRLNKKIAKKKAKK